MRKVSKQANSTSVSAARPVGIRVSLHSEPELMVPIPPGPVGLRPEDPPAVPVRPPSEGLLHERDGVAHKTRDEIVLQKQQMQIHPHLGTAARRWSVRWQFNQNNTQPSRGKAKQRTEEQFLPPPPGTPTELRQRHSQW